jgi:hypothetical protein
MQSNREEQIGLDQKTREFYCHALETMTESGAPFLVGGAYALEQYTGIARQTKDLDIFVRPRDCARILAALSGAGYGTELTSAHWLAKAFCGESFVDIIFNSGNGISLVDNLWFENAVEGEVLGMPVRLCPPEEMIWSKGFVMERERFDGADIIHLIRACGDRLDWGRLLLRFGPHWQVLFSHLILFGFVYPGERSKVPDWVMQELLDRLQDEINSLPIDIRLCQGTLLSRVQYLVDVERWGYQDARVTPVGPMTPDESAQWTEAAENKPVTS